MTLTTPNHLPVHCCCEPSKRLGWVRIDGERRPKQVRFCTERASYALTRSQMDYGMPMKTPARYIETEIAWLTQGSDRPILAVKSAHADITEWRKVVGFIEDNLAGHRPTDHVCTAAVRGGHELLPARGLREEAVPARLQATVGGRAGSTARERAGSERHEAGAHEPRPGAHSTEAKGTDEVVDNN